MNLRPSLLLVSSLILSGGGCAQTEHRPEYAEVAQNVHLAAHRPPSSIRPDEPMATALDPAPTPPSFSGPSRSMATSGGHSPRTGPCRPLATTCSR